MGPKDLPDTTKISISKTDVEREQALAVHKMNGLIKGDQIIINRNELPGAILFPAIKYKDIEMESNNNNIDNNNKNNNNLQVHRYLVISRERFVVLDSNGEGVGSKAVVKSNHHLTEVLLLLLNNNKRAFIYIILKVLILFHMILYIRLYI